MPRVVLLRCESYNREEVYSTVKRGIELLGGIEKFLPRLPEESKNKETEVLIKPNLLAPDPPEKASTTHPSVFYAVAKHLVESNYTPVYGDSSIVGIGRIAAKANGIKKIAEELGIGYVPFRHGVDLEVPGAIQMKRFTIAEDVVRTNAIVNMPKLKTHGLMIITGALKNLFGVIPGVLKPELHVQLSDPVLFARMIVDLNIAIKSVVNGNLIVMDAVYSMEGNGPRNGNPVKTGLLMFSDDAVAIDAVASRIMGMKPEEVPLLREAKDFGFGEIDLNKIEILGDPLSEFTGYTFKLPPETRGSNELSSTYRFARNSVIPKPVIDSRKCTGCGICVSVCPVKPKALSQERKGRKGTVPHYDYSLCIRCYCCQESCPEGAISIKVPLLGRIIHGVSSRINL